MKIRKIIFSSPVLLAVLIISIFTLFFTASISYKRFQSVTDSEKLVIHSHQVVHSLEELFSTLKDAETGQRGYLLTRDTSFLRPYTTSLNIVRSKMDTSKLLMGDDVHQKKKLDSLYKLIDHSFNMLEANIENESFQYVMSASAKSLLLSGKDVMDDIRNSTASIIEVEKAKLIQRQREHAKETQISPITFLYTAFFALFVFVFAFIKICSDVNRLKKANNQLLINKNLFEHSESFSNICNWCWNLDSNVLTFSNNIFNLLKCSEDEFDETVEGYLNFVHPEDKNIILESSNRELNENELSVLFYRIIRKDNELRYFKSVSKLIKDNYDKNIRIGVIKDITEYHLASKVLEDKVFDLERTNKELLAFNHVASHDLQEPLRKIRTFISRIEEEDTDLYSENNKKYFSRIKFAAKRMQKLIDDLLTFSRMNKAEQAFEKTDLNVIMNNSLLELIELIEEKKATINTSSLPTLSVIPFQIQQLFTNLIGNSLKYSKENVLPIITISSEIVCGKDLINSTFTNENKLLKISFSDNGIGFEQEYAKEIFTLFKRLHTKSEFSGNGIGLAICKKIVENHKGFIIAEAVPNEGTQFIVFLPTDN